MNRYEQLAAIFKLLSAAKREITQRLEPFEQHVTHRDVRGDADKGEADYAASLMEYIKEVEKVRKDIDPKLSYIAGKISALGGKDWQDDKDIVQAWMAFAHVVQALRHNPEKGPGVVYVSENNDLISYAAANFWLGEMKPSEKLQRKHLTYPDGRSALNICAEPAAIAKVVGHDALDTARVLRGKNSKDDGHPLSNSDFIPASKMPERRLRFLDKVSSKGRKSGAFNNATLITTADPCGSCTQAVVDVGIALVISDAETHHHPMSPKRMDEMKKAERTLSSNGVAHRHVHYVNNL